ncbi:hypothetical protein VST7929_01535 [Vibrio stylophorae]|uniref:DUF2798 domain-containing protein n=1 Tax=Vibrio stylophorae TaxID=659351 RepID=A0ABN8DR90_9VIBR|nr:DUF2798 domain-containing protein [Vibrio stylophorae]CAH0533664.1 hypothetical protein VST7929_01535 [Vibrio stylophorae]
MTRIQFWLTAVLSSLTMASCMSGVLTTINTGIDAMLLNRWFHSFSIAWPIALTLNLLILPQVRRLAAWLSQKLHHQR